MLLMSARDRPCSARAWASSPWRETSTLEPSIFAAVRGGRSRFNLPLGPSTRTLRPLTWTFTWAGMTTGCLPMRDMKWWLKSYKVTRSPDVAEQFATDIILAGLLAAHETLRSGQYRRAQAAAHAGDVGGADIVAQSGFADPAQAFDDALLTLVLELELNRFRDLADDRVVSDVAFLLQDAGNALLHAGVRHCGSRQQRLCGVANAGQHVGNRISHTLSMAESKRAEGQERNHLGAPNQSPTRLRDAGNQPPERIFAERQARAAELAQVGVSAAGLGATVDHAHRAGVLGQLAQRGVVLLLLQLGAERGVLLHGLALFVVAFNPGDLGHNRVSVHLPVSENGKPMSLSRS